MTLPGSDNVFPKLKLSEQGSDPPAADTGEVTVFARPDGGVYAIDDGGLVSQLGVADTTVLNKYDATADPTATDDDGDGYSVGSVWINVTDDEAFICVDASTGAAVWNPFDSGGGSLGPATLDGGTETTDGTWNFHAFTSSGTIDVDVAGLCDILLVGGGGGGGGYFSGGGGGGGQVLVLTDIYLDVGTYTVTVGAGGTAGASTGSGTTMRGSPGGWSGLPDVGLRAIGGGGGGGAMGGASDGAPGNAGGNGGGAGARQSNPGGVSLVGGNAGGNALSGNTSNTGSGGGGGGAGAAGTTAATTGNGGNGTDPGTWPGGASGVFGGGGGGGSSAVTNTPGTGGTGGGGNGGASSTNTGMTAGTANTGGGGGGGGNTGTNGAVGGAGGSGYVVLRTPV